MLEAGSPPRRLRPALLLLGLLAAIVTVGVQASTGRPATSPGTTRPSDADSATATAGSARPTEPVSLPPLTGAERTRIDRRVDQIASEVQKLRGLELRHDFERRYLDVAEVKEELARSLRSETAGAWYPAHVALHGRLGLLDPGDDLRDLMVELSGEALSGYYDPQTERMTIVRHSEAFDVLEEAVIAHELTHVLQDQNFGLDGLSSRLVLGDQELGFRALVEGDATVVMQDWMEKQGTLDAVLKAELSRLTAPDPALLLRVPGIIARQSNFPYVDGAIFVEERRLRGGWEAVDAAYADPPTTEEVMHPELYGEDLSSTTYPALDPAALGPRWRAGGEETLGEAVLHIWLTMANGATASRRAADGWDGDLATSYESASGGWMVIWRTAWDSSSQAREFRDAAGRVLEHLGGVKRVVARPGGVTVTMLLADSAASLADASGAIGNSGTRD
jgi:hypothetical protein